MSFFRKFRLILWKNWILRKRHYILSALDILLPLLFTFMMVAIRTNSRTGPSTFIPTPTFYKREIVGDGYCYSTDKTLMYTPDNNDTKKLVSSIRYSNEGPGCQLYIAGVKDEAAMEQMSRKAYLEKNDSLLGGISFVNYGLSSNLHYRIRLRRHTWHTERLTDPYIRGSAPAFFTSSGYEDQFIVFQHAVAMKFIEIAAKRENLTKQMEVYTERFPYPPYHEDNSFINNMKYFFSLFVILSYFFVAPSLIRGVVLEKDLGTKELMKLMGLPGWIQWLGWFVSSFIVMTISAIIIVALLCIPMTSQAVIAHSRPELMFIIFLLYIASAISFCFFISSMFSRPTLATAVGILAWIVSFAVPYYLLIDSYYQLSFSKKMSLALLPNMAMAWALQIITSFEGGGTGLQWYSLSEFAYKGENIYMLHVMVMFVVDVVVYGILTWYIDAVFPGKYGVRKPWYFLFTKSYWIKEKLVNIDIESHPSHVNSAEFENEPTNLVPTIVIKHLSKRYSVLPQGKLAVDDLSLNFYEGQITALLGHNGAGKTTTMSMLTGMFSPSSGTALVNGYDIRTHMDAARESIGLCPQHNMLFDVLTVQEHLELFGKLKNITGTELETEMNTLMNKLQLWDKRNTFAKNLSGGMKRKLNLGIALIGKSKVVMLDEPTSGMDPEARRAIWDLLQEYRPGKCIVLTTHFMEEADVLGDRIAIMAEGKAQCCGTPYFLKKRFGAGYHLTVTQNSSCNIEQLGFTIQRHLPECFLNTHVNNELSYILPAEKSSHFPALFEELENNMRQLGINGFGVSVTTMEEVFFKVGELSEKMDDDSDPNQDGPNKPILATLNEDSQNWEFNTGCSLVLQQLYGLLLKRWHYARRRWILIFAQVIMPVLMVVLLVYINNTSGQGAAGEAALKMDISQYGKTVALEAHNNTEKKMADAYGKIFPSGVTVERTDNVSSTLIKRGNESIDKYRNDYIVAAEFQDCGNEIKCLTAMYNGIYLHTMPLSLNLIHNTILKQQTSSSRTITVENAPLPIDTEAAARNNQNSAQIQSVITGIFLPIGLSFVSSSFVVFPIQERVSKSKHLQLMTGVGGISFWGISFLWDFMIHFISSCLMLIVFVYMDDSKTFSGKEQSGVIFSLLVLYGWAAIPFTYMVSFIARLPVTGFAVLSIVNMIAGMVFSMMISFFSASANLKDLSKVLQWLFRFLPNYSITIAFMNMPLISRRNSFCDIFDEEELAVKCPNASMHSEVKKCCPDCVGSECLGNISYYAWDTPSLGQEVFMLAMVGAFYLLLLFLIERGTMYRGFYALKKCCSGFRRKQTSNELAMEASWAAVDDDVAAEKHRINQLFKKSEPSDDALLVDDMTKQFGSFRAVDHLCFGVKSAECFGLLGINGAGKTTTFRMLTGDERVTLGNAYLHGRSLKADRGNFLKQISYCPQFDAILDHLTGRETLFLFARLRGIPEAEISSTIDQFLRKFDLTQHADKITMAYSGGNKRKLSAAIAFLGNPPMVFLDEPTTGVDPVARRKLWDILLSAKNRGTSLILTSHSMEECEVLCSRLAIMVNGHFKCLGAIQHLKNKFGQGFTVIAKMGAYADASVQSSTQQQLQEFMKSKFPGSVLKDVHQGLIHYHVTDVRTPWRYLFSTMEQAKQEFHLEDYSVSQTTLEQVFLSFARQQRTTTPNNFVPTV